MKDLIELLTRRLVDEPDEVAVLEVERPGTVTYEVHVAVGDAGKVIGKGGRVINALRTVAKASAVQDGRRVFVELIG